MLSQTAACECSLAKEAALHDPFAGLASLKPSAAPKHSPPLKNFGQVSPRSAAGGQFQAPVAGQQGAPQQQLGQAAANGAAGASPFFFNQGLEI